MRRWLWILLVILVLAGGIFAYDRYRAAQQALNLEDLQTVEVMRGPLTATVGATGTVQANQHAQLIFKTSGTVESVIAKVGQEVSQGDLLASLQQTSLPSQLILAEADLIEAQRALDEILNSSVSRAQAQQSVARALDQLENVEYMWRVRQEGNRASENVLEEARANLLLAKNELDRAQEIYDHTPGDPDENASKALALSNLSAARQHVDAIQRKLNWYTGYPTEVEQALLDADVAVAEASLMDAEREWERLKDGPDPNDIAVTEARIAAAQANLELAAIKAPFDGVISASEVKPGDQISQGTFAFELVDLSRLLVDVEVSEVDINRVEVGQSAILTFDAVLGREYLGQVVEIGLTGKVVQGVVNFIVTVELQDLDEAVKPGMTAAVNLVVDQLEEVLLVPNRAVRVVEGERVVYIIRDNRLQRIRIELGVSSDTYSEVVGGDLEQGQMVVLNPPAVFETGNGPPPFVRGG
jgi:HlyD family secretion protein